MPWYFIEHACISAQKVISALPLIIISFKIQFLSTQLSPSHFSFCPVCLCLVVQLCPTLCDPMDFSSPGSSTHGILQARIMEWVSHAHLQGIFPIQGSNPVLPHCRQMLYHLFTTGVGYLSLLQRSFLARESNQGLLHCRQILYQLSYQPCISLFKYLSFALLTFTPAHIL